MKLRTASAVFFPSLRRRAVLTTTGENCAIDSAVTNGVKSPKIAVGRARDRHRSSHQGMIAALKIVTAQKSVWQSHLSAVFRRGGVAPVSAMVLPKVIGCLPRSMRTSVSNACRPEQLGLSCRSRILPFCFFSGGCSARQQFNKSG